ncbi:hypothetical protein [Aeromonas piscicola]|uniref:hypothetical protein n=1 Tax=Aeromonas piscicola TaxID=600645 RepID=UPI0028E5950E|nr:hypothetical protein [Aeromonas piscicola]
MSTDNDLCEPALKRDELEKLFIRIDNVVNSILGEGTKPTVFLDLEHLQIADYATFPPNTEEQQQAIRNLQKTEPIRPDEMIYLALRSMIAFSWGKPKSEADIQRAAAYESVLEMTLTEVSLEISNRYELHDSPLPYWGRLGFLRVMASIPEEQIKELCLQEISCTLLKNPVFNARSFQFAEHGIVGINYAIEPILKNLNRMLLHFYHTQDMSGPKRLERAWQGIMPIVAYFWTNGSVPTNKLTNHYVLFEKSMVEQAHSLTARQVDFILRHELGHLVLGHAKKLNSLDATSEAKITLQHEFEFAADAFAHGNHRSALYNYLRLNLQWSEESTEDLESKNKSLQGLYEYQAGISSTRLLFIYMDVIDQAGRMLKRRLGDDIRFRTNIDSHPSPSERLARLDTFNIGEYSPTSELLRYANSFFSDVLEYANNLEDIDLSAPIQSFY